MTSSATTHLLTFPAVRKVLGWVTVMYRWAREGGTIWLTLIVLGLAWLFIGTDVPGTAQDLRVRVAGGVLQLLGILTVFLGYENTRKLFGHPRAFVALWHWLKRVPWRGPRPIHGIVRATLPGVHAHAAGGVAYTPAAELTPDQRIKALEEASRKMQTEINLLRDDFTRERRARAEQLEEVKQHAENRAKAANELLAAIHTGGLSISIAGLVWLAAGVVLTCVSEWFS